MFDENLVIRSLKSSTDEKEGNKSK